MTSLHATLARQRAGGGLPAAAAGALSLANFLLPPPARVVLGLPLAFWAPGYCVAILIFGRRAWIERFDGLIRLAVECVLSMAAWPLLVLVTYVIRPRVTASSVESGFLALVVATLICIQFTRRTAVGTATNRLQISRLPRVPITAVAVVALGGGLTAALASTLPPQQGTTASAVALAGGAASADAPLARNGVGGGTVSITIYNPGTETRDYRITPTVTGAHAWSSQDATVAPDSHRTVQLAGTLPSTACLVQLSIVVADGAERLDPLVVYFQGNRSSSCEQ